MSNGPVEPTADLREAANAIWQLFNALMNEGFSERQSLVIVGQVIAAQKGDEQA